MPRLATMRSLTSFIVSESFSESVAEAMPSASAAARRRWAIGPSAGPKRLSE